MNFSCLFALCWCFNSNSEHTFQIHIFIRIMRKRNENLISSNYSSCLLCRCCVSFIWFLVSYRIASSVHQLLIMIVWIMNFHFIPANLTFVNQRTNVNVLESLILLSKHYFHLISFCCCTIGFVPRVKRVKSIFVFSVDLFIVLLLSWLLLCFLSSSFAFIALRLPFWNNRND